MMRPGLKEYHSPIRHLHTRPEHRFPLNQANKSFSAERRSYVSKSRPFRTDYCFKKPVLTILNCRGLSRESAQRSLSRRKMEQLSSPLAPVLGRLQATITYANNLLNPQPNRFFGR